MYTKMYKGGKIPVLIKQNNVPAYLKAGFTLDEVKDPPAVIDTEPVVSKKRISKFKDSSSKDE